VDSQGNTREFLYDYYDDPKDALRDVFLKGYEWPFHAAKKDASSKIDLCVYRESVILGRQVYLDFREEPSALADGGFGILSDEARTYLSNSDALIEKPLARLLKMNRGAYELYLANGIDLAREPLRIAVCAQHNNGGADVDVNWQTNINGLYVAGEAASTHGVTRPGGSALNSTQVSGIRIARHIASLEEGLPIPCDPEKEAGELRFMIEESRGDRSTCAAVYEKAAAAMSKHFAFLRDPIQMERAYEEIETLWKCFPSLCKWKEQSELPIFFKVRDTLCTQLSYAGGMIYAATHAGSRGGALVLTADGEAIPEDVGYRSRKILTQYTDGCVKSSERPVRPIPYDRELWFEKVWNKRKK
jgi:hypothetical protein